ncbi:flagellar biosynthesis protein [Primorskyibacter flagellatus]|uniref:Flagellar biosynthesis protein n=1 Tax=Primorskyibacter flagellatus TaxID=1387277 RepID=A0A917AEY0_9RHOB|nr:ABC transporter ATP-binding protein [Primorskyibacter flagellatus]GGE47271.1 flagellar biosynthesis protein [Primorskyibacter flagellatus]
MSISHLLEDFGQPPASPVTPQAMTEESLETLRLEAFENGYKAGWDDSLKAQDGEATRIRDDFARNLQDLSFTYHEAHSHVMQSVTGLLEDIVALVLPEAMRQTLGPRVVEQLTEMAGTAGAQEVEIVSAPADLPLIRSFLEADAGFPVTATADDTLAEGQVFLRMSGQERQIDLDPVIAGIREAVETQLQETERSVRHG